MTEKRGGMKKKFADLKKSITFAVAINVWEDRIVAIAADCKSAPSGSVVRVHLPPHCGSSSVGRASAFQAEGRGFEPRLPL